ncbi:hypothetical protein BU23DRAFT_604296 [Bimuria novae-zelandiae CBS 107.79]|uniref:RNA polymerase I-specific transcription initiation factor RRN6-like protein n=1 Tax=Bimuria novae-zelandiae CBS 107.79 TaxID=1447943 RepID=A0A6A5UMZ5_9PLEO|nr:hypothetical protein BU23DRAFT_604296 [Bimuria novae-zelandiae CBS 107.79]
MTEVSPNHLNCGHFGLPAYDQENNSWAFPRIASGSGFRQLGHWTTIIPAAVHFPSANVPRTLSIAQHATNSAFRDRPELIPARQHVPELEAVSAAATATLAIYDPAVGQLMSIGTITASKKSARRIRQVVALPTGEAGNILRLQLLVNERHGWPAEQHNQPLCYIEGPSLKGDFGFWNQDATAIQQVCFAQSEEPGSLLAVRLPQRIVLFHSVLLSRPTAAATSPLYNLPPSALDIRPFHSVWTEDTGGALHADVSFNPHYQLQFAIVAQDSSWSIWDIDGGRRAYTVKLAVSGNMSIKEEMDSNDDHKTATSWKEDGWARILWVGDANTILICNRRRLELMHLKDSARSLKLPQVIDGSSSKNPSEHWILDVRRHPTNEKLFFVLTSARLYLFSVTCVSDMPRDKSRDVDAAAILMSWTHFRGAEDITLQLFVESTSEDEIAVFVSSRLNTLITVYHLTDHPSTTVPYRSFGPTTVRLDTYKNSPGPKTILNFNIARLNYKDSNGGPRGSGHIYEDHGARFYQLSAIFNDLSVAQTILCSLGPDAWEKSLEDVEATSWSRVKRQPAWTALSQNTASSGEDDFVEPDGLIDAPAPLLKPMYPSPQFRSRKPIRSIVNFRGLYAILASNQPIERDSVETSTETMDIAALVDELRWRLDRKENVAPFASGTMQEYAGVVTVDDIDEVSAKLEELSLTEHASSLELRRIASDHVLGFVDDKVQESLPLSSVYDLVLQNWVASLPGSIPARIRQNKERMARRIATGLVLASTRVRESKDVDFTATHPGPSQDSAVALSLSLPLYSSQPDLQLPSSQPNESNGFDVPPAPNTVSSDLLTRLSKHLAVNSSKPLEIRPSISQVLTHWQLGTDPSKYDWEATERAFAEELELEQEGTQKRREKARRKKERQAKRQKKENQRFTGRVESGLVESQPQMLRQPQVQRSSPGPYFPGSSQAPTQSSSQMFGGMLGVQSQVEPGRHGGRLAKKKKGKSRMSGF